MNFFIHNLISDIMGFWAVGAEGALGSKEVMGAGGLWGLRELLGLNGS